MNMKNFVLCLLLSPFVLLAKPIDLICQKQFDKEVSDKTWINWDTKKVKCETDGCYGYDEYPEINEQRWQRCKSSKVAFEYKIRLDTDTIESGSGQGENTITQNCEYLKDSSFEIGNSDDGKVLLTNIKVTPSYIMFSRYTHFNNPFQVERKTLIGEDKQKGLSNFQCEIKEVKEAENLL